MTKLNLAKEIADYLNQVNRNTFNQDEIQETVNEYLTMLENEDAQQILDTLVDEYNNTNDSKAKELFEKVKFVTRTNRICNVCKNRKITTRVLC